MAVYRIVDDKPISEIDYLRQSDRITGHLTARTAAASEIRPLMLSSGVTLTGTPPASNIPFTAVGPGKPLTVTIRHVYTGKFPDRSFFGSRGDIAIVSGVKNFSAFDATARAVNFLETGVAPRSHFATPTAFNQGTPIISYSPAVIDPATTISVEMAISNGFPRELLDHIGTAFQSLAGVPVLLPYVGYLMGASSVIKLAEGVADDLYQSQPAFLRTEVLNFSLPGSPQVQADWRIICNPSLDASSFTYRDGIGLCDTAGAVYSGEEPYVVVSLDGAPNDDLKGFTPNVASSAVMQKFFQIKDGSEAAIDTLVSAVSLYSDLKYRQQADKLKQQIDQTTDATAKAALQDKYNAVIKNITDSTLVPKS